MDERLGYDFPEKEDSYKGSKQEVIFSNSIIPQYETWYEK